MLGRSIDLFTKRRLRIIIELVAGDTWLLLEHEGGHLEVEEGVQVFQALGHVGPLVVERSLDLDVKVDQTLLDLQPTNLKSI